jgi:hypothetical protein
VLCNGGVVERKDRVGLNFRMARRSEVDVTSSDTEEESFWIVVFGSSWSHVVWWKNKVSCKGGAGLLIFFVAFRY